MIFRCGVFRTNYEHIPPHLSKQECERLISANMIFGCGKPFILKEKEKEKEKEWIAVESDYI